jgi:hypothetical protein
MIHTLSEMGTASVHPSNRPLVLCRKAILAFDPAGVFDGIAHELFIAANSASEPSAKTSPRQVTKAETVLFSRQRELERSALELLFL